MIPFLAPLLLDVFFFFQSALEIPSLLLLFILCPFWILLFSQFTSTNEVKKILQLQRTMWREKKELYIKLTSSNVGHIY